ncbi:ribokinase-like [Drosophila hydei]|uniref:Ribokinase n=1 Tax=Drosophila hydei TaxID=7224 RepID=A0A6J1LD30_DROHY|nr:ribokinase-like [Drosophila hydei]
MYKSLKSSFKSFLLKLKLINFLTTPPPCKHKKEKMELDVLVFGSSNIDYITYVNELPKTGETVFAMHRERCYGGKGANQCVAAAKLGAKCALVSKLGDDELGVEYLEYLKNLEINVDHVGIVEGQCTGLTEINVADNAQNMNIVLSGANLLLKGADATNAKKLFKNSKVLICQLETDEKAVLYALRHFKGVSILNASPAHKNMNVELIKAPTILCCNRLEAAQLTNREQIVTLQEAKAAATDLVEMGAKSVIITMGDMGAVYLSSSEPDLCTRCPAAPVRYLADTSGASDAFLGSLAYHIAIYPNLIRESHIIAANICAAYAVGHRGTQPSFPGPDLFQERLCQFDPLYYIIDDDTVEPVSTVEAAPVAAAEVRTDPESVKEPEPVREPEPVKESEAVKEPERITATEPIPTLLATQAALAIPASKAAPAAIAAAEAVSTPTSKSTAQILNVNHMLQTSIESISDSKPSSNE